MDPQVRDSSSSGLVKFPLSEVVLMTLTIRFCSIVQTTLSHISENNSKIMFGGICGPLCLLHGGCLKRQNAYSSTYCLQSGPSGGYLKN